MFTKLRKEWERIKVWKEQWKEWGKGEKEVIAE